VSVGSYNYSLHPTTQLLCACYALDDLPIQRFEPWRNADGVFDATCAATFRRAHILHKERFACPVDLREAVLSGALIYAHNAMFERLIWTHILTPYYGWPAVRPEQWVCTMAIARYNGLPGGLGDTAKALDIDLQKSDSSAMKKMCKPRATWLNKGRGNPWFADDDLYRELVDYCVIDVEVERAIAKKCRPLPPKERKIWLLDQEINLRGVPVDRPLVDAACVEADAIYDDAGKELATLTKGAADRPTQKQRIKEWLQRRMIIEDMQAATIEHALTRHRNENHLDDDTVRVLEICQLAGGNALAKYKAIQRYANNGRIYDAYRYYAGHTGRGGGQGVQMQNLIRPPLKLEIAEQYIPYLLGHEIYLGAFCDGQPVKPVLDSLVRASICAPPGKTLVALDFSSVEARGVNWVSGQWDVVELFEKEDALKAAGRSTEGMGVYENMAGKIFGMDPIAVKKDSFERFFGKTVELGSGYGMGPPRLQDSAHERGVEIELRLAERAVKAYRRSHRRVRAYWYEVDEKVKRCIRTGKSLQIGRNVTCRMGEVGNVACLAIVLPSGRSLFYPRIRVESDRIKYWGRRLNGSLGFVGTWGGALVENIVQAFCRDLLMGAMLRISERYEIIMHTHDEVCCLVDEADAQAAYGWIADVLTAVPLWATGMPLAVEGWIGQRGRK
jgi:DNA polymerase